MGLTRHKLSVHHMIKTADSNLQNDAQMKQSNCFPGLTLQQKAQKYKQNGFVPEDPAHLKCIICSHEFVDKPNKNKMLQADFQKLLQAYEEKKQVAKEEAKKNNLVAPCRVTAPKLSQPYRQCHCHQMFCVSVGTNIGSSCPIQCKDTSGKPFGTDISGNCACPICKCQCFVTYTYDAPQIHRTRQLFGAHTESQRKEIEFQKSRSIFASLIQDSSDAALKNPILSHKSLSIQGLCDMAGTASAQSIASLFDPSQHGEFLCKMRDKIGRPTTRVVLPAPIQINGKMMDSSVDTRMISGQKAQH
jgi:hypothetical protein